MVFKFNDGGRSAAGFKGTKRPDCVTRAVSIASSLSYTLVHDQLSRMMNPTGDGIHGTADNGVLRKHYDRFLKGHGFTWVPCMSIGSGCKVHLRSEELPKGRIIVRLSRHIAAVIDGVLNDTYDCSRGGTRCVYGYYIKREIVS